MKTVTHTHAHHKRHSTSSGWFGGIKPPLDKPQKENVRSCQGDASKSMEGAATIHMHQKRIHNTYNTESKR
jgi:hypothetical protein